MTIPPLPRTLTIAGSDSSGGAGIQADLKTFTELDTFGMSVIVALTAQNTMGVHGVDVIDPSFVTAQLDAVASDVGVDAAKTGMLATPAIIDVVAKGVHAHGIERLVVDPVCASKHGDALLEPEAIDALRRQLLPLAELVTPNLGEVQVLTGVQVHDVSDMPRAADAMLEFGSDWVLIKGGHLPDNTAAIDLLSNGDTTLEIASERIDAVHTHGTGCTLAAAIAAGRAARLHVTEAVQAGKDYVTGAIRHGLTLGSGIGPVDHGWRRR